jgi:putative membrane protein insertion efficiency factor
MSKIVVRTIQVYKKAFSWLFPNTCRFTPTCSEYMIAAIEKKGLLLGAVLGVKRLLKCHPYHPGGFDPLI